ncbi:MAG: hypothetical protein ACRDG7_08365 [Candidatus Limnocylindria bacterium]
MRVEVGRVTGERTLPVLVAAHIKPLEIVDREGDVLEARPFE